MTDRLPPQPRPSIQGTDEFGRDILTRVIYGAPISFQIALVAVVVATLFGVTIGVVSAYFEKWVNLTLQRGVDIMLAFPGLLLALAVIAALGPSITNVMLAVGIGSTPFFARLVRGSVLTVREEEYVTAARVTGANDARIVGRYILPNVLSPIVVDFSAGRLGPVFRGGAVVRWAGRATTNAGMGCHAEPGLRLPTRTMVDRDHSRHSHRGHGSRFQPLR